ncbi:MAG: DNA mismatch repair endonuclease MutL [Clostridia bacterium]|nr:DNA mismatch repair endonuclease MutL [Clostridia bacterium]
MEQRPIIRLDEEIIGKIAAGEVVESPASAVKELVENSLDAGANCVTVEIRDGGITYLRVTDNGRGIPSRDVRLAFERHATSKIRRSEDLYDLHTLGFRGEALASIAAVSKLTLTTRFAGEDTGMRAINEGGVIKSIAEAASPQGTTIVARELFYNTPVRLKFLKKPVTEASKVADVIARMILAHPNIAFRLMNNGKQVYASSGNGDLRSAVFCLYGREDANAMIAVRSEGAVSVTGLVGAGAQARASRQRQTFIVNGRTIRSQLLTQALEEGCRERVTIGHYPTCVLNIDMPVGMVDVNVHPNKLEVRFSDERLIFGSVSGAVRDSFAVSPLMGAPRVSLVKEEGVQAQPGVVRVIDTQTEEGREAARQEAARVLSQPEASEGPSYAAPEERREEGATDEREPAAKPTPVQQAAFTSFVAQYFGGAALRESALQGKAREKMGFSHLEAPAAGKIPSMQASPDQTRQTPAPSPAKQPESSGGTVRKAEEEEISEAGEPAKGAPTQETLLAGQEDDGLGAALAGYQMVGVAFDTYILLQNDKQLIFIDQHAAHERILYEKLMREIDQGKGSQVLLAPQVVQVTPQDSAKIENYAEEIRAAGFDVEPFGDNAYSIRAVPNVLGVPQSRGAFLDMVDHLGELRVLSTQQKRRDAILQMACKKAVKGGDRLTMEEIRPLLSDMLATGAPPTCPHGRPLVVVLTRSELEKRFRRIND